MNINSNEILLLNKMNNNLGMKKMPKNAQSAPMAQQNYEMNALDAQGMNNVAFQGIMSKVAKPLRPLLVAAALTAGAAATQSCVDVDSYSKAIAEVDMSGVEARLDSLNNNINRMRAEWNAAFSDFDKYLMQMILQQKITNEELNNIKGAQDYLNMLVEQNNIKLDDAIAILNALKQTVEGNHVEVINMMKKQTENQDLMLDVLYNIKGDLAEYVKAILNKQDLSIEAQNKGNEYLALLFGTVQNINVNNGATNELLKAILEVVTKDLEQDRVANEERNEFYKAVLKELGKMNDEQAKFFTAVLAKLDKMDAQQIKFYSAVLDRLDKLSETITEQGKTNLDKVLKAIDKNTEAVNNNTEVDKLIYAAVLDILNNYQGGVSDDLLDYLNTIIKNQNTSLGNQDQIIKNQAAFMSAVAKAMATMDEHQQDGVKKIVEAITTGDTNIVNAIEGLGKDGKEALAEIIKAINSNTKVAQGTYDLMVKVAASANSLDGKADKILKAIEDLALSGGGDVDLTPVVEAVNKIFPYLQALDGKGGTIISLLTNLYNKPGVDLTEITKLLNKILSQEQTNGKVLVEIRDKIEYMKLAMDQLKPILIEQANDTESIRALLKKFYEAYKPCEGHNCDHSELVKILGEMKIVIEEIKENTKNHEGILDDIDLG